jgi:multidrug efflux pump subunit AcrA (membrane-fusion protein)
MALKLHAKKKQFAVFCTITLLISLTACSGNKQSESSTEAPPKVSVRVTHLTQGTINSYITVNGKTVFLKKNGVMAPLSGYITEVHVRLGDKVRKNQVLFTLQTKEDKALSSSPELSKNSGKINVLAPLSGYVSDLSITAPGAYVTEGSVLGNITENQQVSIQVNMPFEYHALLTQHANCIVKLPDQTSFKGTVSRLMPTVDPVSQTQTAFIQLANNRLLPENLNVTVLFVNTQHPRALLLPKTAVLTNETQERFWVMKIVHDTLAIQVPVVKGIENDSLIEIISPSFTTSDPIITEGAYGLTDKTAVKIIR